MPAANEVIEHIANQSGGAEVYQTGAVTLEPGRLYFLTVSPSMGASGVVEPTVTSPNATWVLVTSRREKANDIGAYLFRTMVSAQQVDEVITVDFGTGNGQDNCGLGVYSIQSVPTTGADGADAVLQAVTGGFNSGTTLSATLAAFENATNNLVFAFGTQWTIAGTHLAKETGYTAGTVIGTGGTGTRNQALAEWKQGEDLSPSETSDVSSDWILLAVEVDHAAAETVGRPDGDVTTGSFVDEGGASTDLFQSIDEEAAADADYVESPAAPSNAVYVCSISTVEDPNTSSGQIVSFRYGKSGAETVNLTIELRQGYVDETTQGTLIATRTINDIPATPTDGQVTLSSGEADSITDYSALSLRLVFNQV